MEIRLLKKDCIKKEEFYKDFLDDKIIERDEYFSDEVVHVKEAPDFPIYMGKGSEEEKAVLFKKAFEVMDNCYLDTDRDIHMNEMFWYSLLCVHKRDFLLKEYPQIGESIKDFQNIVVKKFDWENYIYKCVLGAQYVKDNTDCDEDRDRYYDLIVENLDVYNYMIKYEVFRNDKFIINVLDIIDDRGLAKVLKAKIKDRPDLGKDERYGRRVLFEFNKAYPIVMSPMLEKDELEVLFMEYLGYYYDLSKLECVVV
ncbi:hypothetical protein [Terrisporobacter sp.]|uniref:hypothetical protein n=1 Tax=Terrisporobacter sp. TaxID=1965305 RepID=UPI002635A7CF|nr:hypothetical protein [Terrisporobacter sp.]